MLVVDTVGFAPGVLNAADHEQRSAARRRALHARSERDDDHARVHGDRSRLLHGSIHGQRHDRRRRFAVRAGRVLGAHVRRLLGRRRGARRELRRHRPARRGGGTRAAGRGAGRASSRAEPRKKSPPNGGNSGSGSTNDAHEFGRKGLDRLRGPARRHRGECHATTICSFRRPCSSNGRSAQPRRPASARSCRSRTRC